ncbi:MAG: DUF4343 domain-containing protein [Anaerolineaceae bacterium]|nr:DUF4343 domain-containing protein [Anaerolineaceae bacterium]
MPTLILSPRYTPDSNALWKAALDDADWTVERLQSHRPPAYLKGKDIAIYGEALFVNIVADELGLALLEPPFDFLAHLPRIYLLRNVRFTTLDDARNLRETAFIKPAYDKSFDSRVYATGQDLPTTETLPGDLPVLVSEPVSWEIEFRSFIVERQLATLSIYLRYGQLARSEDGSWPVESAIQDEASQFIYTLLQDDSIDLPPAFVLDIGKINGRGWAVVEANPAWASGIYDCNPVDILTVLKRACIQQENLIPTDARWIFTRTV